MHLSNLNPKNLKQIIDKQILSPLRPKVSLKANIYFLSKRLVDERKKKEKIKRSIVISSLIFVVISSIFTIKPKEGSLILFPSWFKHRVEPSQSQNSRISMSFNYTFTNFLGWET